MALRPDSKFVSLKILSLFCIKKFKVGEKLNMLEGYSHVWQAFFGTLFTWFLTAAGAALVFFLNGTQV